MKSRSQPLDKAGHFSDGSGMLRGACSILNVNLLVVGAAPRQVLNKSLILPALIANSDLPNKTATSGDN